MTIVAFIAVWRTLGTLCLAWLIGGPVFVWLSGRSKEKVILSWRSVVRRSFPWAVPLFILSIIFVLFAEAASTAELSLIETLARPDVLRTFAFQTRVGQLSMFRLIAGMALFAPTMFLAKAATDHAEETGLFLVLVVAAVVCAMGPLTGHAGADIGWSTACRIIHVCAVSIWIGGLPGWLGLVFLVATAPDIHRCAYAFSAMLKFSRLAVICMATTIISGAFIASEYVGSQGDLLGTPYGLAICGKVLLLLGVLVIANHVRAVLLPQLRCAEPTTAFHMTAVRWVTLEFTLAVGIVGLASLLSQLTPALHDQPYWWLPLRISIAATWPVSSTQMFVAGGLLIAVAGSLIACRYFAPGLWRRSALGVSVLAGGAVALPQLAVPSFPDTFRRSEVPYLTLSIFRGKQLFEDNCTVCHGMGGRGDGPGGKSLRRPPADLTAPHTALHTAGDMFWWISNGIPESGMPGFSTAFTELDRWDVINFMRAFSQGFEARVLSPSIIPLRPWVGAPNFYFERVGGEPKALSDYRDHTNVLLVFFSPENKQDLERLHTLESVRVKLLAEGLEILVVARSEKPFPNNGLTVVDDSTGEVRESYYLFARTLQDQGDGESIEMKKDRIEFLIDRFGYIRARWIPQDEKEGWFNTERLREEIAKLNTEPRILPPPDDHVH
ncbi:CopD family protein [Bradyrhizobium diazoefficiens]|nr:CopD family protein [Bradyrhizobium diazoefficiens]MBR0964060.1 CopD family protein [Bradyrhizobium diazoefficiens]MBR0978220.1 CopD family protein [Bradyrhizobium diazoefficiens]MBR1006151.1 CopD family protein [Bradyrhizobium diazoefficiens]MBR1014203.1 CopD family protein [Bradyrhizobium diazoefficiens]MBR1050340.1 CopD family protein [Bradyrhizobium diazoefficiens]